MIFNLFSKKDQENKTEWKRKKINNMYLVKKKEPENSYLLTTEKHYLMDELIVYSNEYLYDYIIRDIVVSLLKNFVVYAYAPDLNEFEDLYTNYMYKEGSFIVESESIDYRLVTDLLISYSDIWYYDGPATFIAYTEKRREPDLKIIYDLSTWEGFAIKIESTDEYTGLIMSIDPEKIDEEELIKRINEVLEGYKMDLEFVEAKD